MKSAGRRLLICTMVLLSGCISAMELRPSYGVVVVYQAVPGSTIKRGIDGIYKDKNGNYIIMESKATGGEKPSDPKGCKGNLCTLTGGERQMSDKWITERLEKLVPDPVERQKILDGLKDGSTKKVYAQTDAAGTTYHEIDNVTPTDVKIGDPWNP